MFGMGMYYNPWCYTEDYEKHHKRKNKKIRKIKGGYIIVNKKGKRLSKPGTKKDAIRLLKQIKFWKKRNTGK
jgi:hypothetical protein